MHARARAVMERIDARCQEWGIERLLIVSHAATIIALGRMLQTQGTYDDVRDRHIRAGTASVSKYVRSSQNGLWHQVYNGRTSFLPHGEERAWDFGFVPDNTTEPGMGPHWRDAYAPRHAHLIHRPKL